MFPKGKGMPVKVVDTARAICKPVDVALGGNEIWVVFLKAFPAAKISKS